MADAPPYLTNPQLLSALTHQTRVHALSVLTDRTASPKELAAELGCSVRHVSYHLEKLEELGVIELVGVDENAGGGRSVEHFYRAIQRAWFDRDAWKEIGGPKTHPRVTAAIMSLINEDIATAITAGTFDGEENHISRTPLVVDREGYEELVSYLAEVLEGIFAIRERAANRIKADTETVQAMVHLIQFDLPPKPASA
ncbi:MAG TPA: winged helix-turn-helix domain-containing protein [Solirubrobacterales bacterium]|nr:winged helix-turn-helix domain-containing protein [Solirubrobacterales bacterium]